MPGLAFGDPPWRRTPPSVGQTLQVNEWMESVRGVTGTVLVVGGKMRSGGSEADAW